MAAVASRTAGQKRSGAIFRGMVIVLVVVFFLLPLISTFLFSVATVWSRTVLPEGYTLDWYRESFADARVRAGIRRSLFATTCAILLGLGVVIPALVWSHLRAPRFKKWLEFLSILPWALPGIVLALALIRTYVGPYNVSRTWILICAYTLGALPLMFRAIDASLSAVDLRTMSEAAQTLGAGWLTILRRVILPNISAGILSAALLTAALASGEYVLSRLLGGIGWRTFALYQAEWQSIDGRVAAALAVLGFTFTWIVSMGLILLSSRRGQTGLISNK